MISATEIGVRSMLPPKNLKGLVQSGPFWCIILIRFSLKKVPLFIIKNNNYSYTPGYHALLLWVILLPEKL